MTATGRTQEPEISVFALGTLLLKHRVRLIAGTIAGALIAGLIAQLRPVVYATSASFVPQGASDSPLSGLAGLAGQFGVALSSGGSQINSPDFYVSLVRGRTLLAGLLDDTIVVREENGRRASIPDLLGVGPSAVREEETVRQLRSVIATNIVRPVGIVEVTVRTKWPSVSEAISRGLLDRINEFTRSVRQAQASEEREFYEERLAVAALEMRQAENAMMDFERRNVGGFGRSPELSAQRERLSRDVVFRQQLYSQIAIAYESGRIKERRDAPGITVIDQPRPNLQREPRRRVFHAVVGAFLGGVIAVLLTLAQEWMAMRRREGDPHADEFFATLKALRPVSK